MTEFMKYSNIIETEYSTIATDFEIKQKWPKNYQSEAELEWYFIEQLQNQWYEYVQIHNKQDLEINLRKQLELLNKDKLVNWIFSDNEWNDLYENYINKNTDEIEDKSFKIQKDDQYTLKLRDWTSRNIKIIDKENIHNNRLQVINQYVDDEWNRINRYDVSILVNWLPLVHIELKRRWVDIKEAFNQIKRYSRESFSHWLFKYVQIFVISNWTDTKYYSNTTRKWQLSNEKISKDSKSFEFTSYWATAKNKPIYDIENFTATFFNRNNLLNILTKYCVLESNKDLKVLRPYQIAAIEKIIQKILISTNNKTLWTTQAWWYIWHTTWSWKTLTSFKTAQIIKEKNLADKVLFVVDRKDLDYQTMTEYDKYEKWAANWNTNTRILAQQLNNDSCKIIITTIQKLDKFIKTNKENPIKDKHVVIIFDECHRSQFWDMNKSIKDYFKNYNMFWFTWTPIFTDNSQWKNIFAKTTEQLFWECLHRYTIIDAIKDKNVLKFKITYKKTIQEQENIKDQDVEWIDTNEILLDNRRISNIVSDILDNFDLYTKRNSTNSDNSYRLLLESWKTNKEIEEWKEKIREAKVVTWFNAMLATQSIDFAKKYYAEFQRQMKDLDENKKLKIWIIYSFWANDEDQDWLIDENPEDTTSLNQTDRDFLENAIKDYNHLWTPTTNFSTESDWFQSYYKDVSLRMKNKELDLLIVVNMFLTWFDAKTLNTLYVDKNLKQHWLIQAFSRTNRKLNSVKAYWNIVCYRNLNDEVIKAIKLFSDEETASWIVLIRKYEEYMNWYYENEKQDKRIEWYIELVNKLKEEYLIWEEILWEENQKAFIKLFWKILKLRNILNWFDEFKWNTLLSEWELQDYQWMYIRFYRAFREENQKSKENVNDDVSFEIELIKQEEINVDYILNLIKQYQEKKKKKETMMIDINRAIWSSIELYKKKELIEKFIREVNESTINIVDNWNDFIKREKREDLMNIINECNLKEDNTFEFMNDCFKAWTFKREWTKIKELLKNTWWRFSLSWDYEKNKYNMIEKLQAYYDKYYDISETEI